MPDTAAPGGRIDCYLDIVSLFSYVAFVDLANNIDTLAAHGVEVEFHPVFLGGIMQASGNKPPWMLPAKGAYLAHDSRRAMASRGIADWATPPDLMARARTQSALRALHAIKAAYPAPALLAALRALFRCFWSPPHAPLTDDAVLADALAGAVAADGRRCFDAGDVARIMAARDGCKPALQAATARALELGAFGAPWLWVTDASGGAEPFFGSDRFGQIYTHLGLPHREVRLLAPGPKL